MRSQPRHALQKHVKALACCWGMQVPNQSPEEQRKFCLFLYRLSHTSKVRGCVLCAITVQLAARGRARSDHRMQPPARSPWLACKSNLVRRGAL